MTTNFASIDSTQVTPTASVQVPDENGDYCIAIAAVKANRGSLYNPEITFNTPWGLGDSNLLHARGIKTELCMDVFANAADAVRSGSWFDASDTTAIIAPSTSPNIMMRFTVDQNTSAFEGTSGEIIVVFTATRSQSHSSVSMQRTGRLVVNGIQGATSITFEWLT